MSLKGTSQITLQIDISHYLRIKQNQAIKKPLDFHVRKNILTEI